MTDIRPIPLEEIDDDALPRDRTGLDPEPLAELQRSIVASGLRLPVELFPLAEPEGPRRYGLLSGFRRLHAFRELAEYRPDRYAAIPAIIREPESQAAALAAMVEENEIRAPLSPWERGHVAMRAHRQGLFDTIEAAVEALYPAANKPKRSRIRSIAHMVDELEGCLTSPERLSQRQTLRIAAACNAGFGHIIRTALVESSDENHASEWSLILPVLTEAEAQAADAEPPATLGDDYLRGKPSRPRRISKPRRSLTIRRQRTRDGYTLHFTGPDATEGLIDDVFDEIDRLFAPAE